MSWINQVGDLLQRYKGASAATPPPDATADFSKVAQQAPPSAIAKVAIRPNDGSDRGRLPE